MGAGGVVKSPNPCAGCCCADPRRLPRPNRASDVAGRRCDCTRRTGMPSVASWFNAWLMVVMARVVTMLRALDADDGSTVRGRRGLRRDEPVDGRDLDPRRDPALALPPVLGRCPPVSAS